MRAARVLVATLAAFALTVVVATPASVAAPEDPFVLTDSFDGVGTPEGAFEAGNVVVDHATGNLLVVDRTNQSVRQFDAAGNPVNFSALGSPKLALPSVGSLAIDNSGGATQGRFYVLYPQNFVEGFSAAGTKVVGPIKPTTEALGGIQAIAVDADGHLWLAYNGLGVVEEHNPDGSLTGLKIGLGAPESPGASAWAIAFDSHDNIAYSGNYFGGAGPETFIRYGAQGWAARSQLADKQGDYVVIDPSTDDIYLGGGGKISSTRFAEPFVLQDPFERMPGLNVKGFAFAGDGQTLFVSEASKISVYERTLPQPPSQVGPLNFKEVKSEGTFVSGLVDTGGGALTSYHFEFASEDEYSPGNYTHTYPVPDGMLPHTTFGDQPFTASIDGFEPLTTYHLRIVLTNATGTTFGPDTLMRTLAAGDSGGAEDCGNALARKQTGATGLPDCRAYELVSASYAGGYDVESAEVPDQEPFAGYPDAAGFREADGDPKRQNRVLYGVHAGVVPGPWNPTNRGVDPYVAVRDPDAQGWTTEYVGLPAELSPEKTAFSSELGGTDSRLRTFAFAGEDLCFPCFATGLETGVPLREPDGDLTQGLSQPAGVPDTARPEGRVAKMLSADGTHLIFGSRYQFAAGGNDDNGNLTVYDRNLVTGVTQVASTDSSGAALEVGDDVSELDVSEDGSRILIATDETEDTAGNEYVRLSMHLGTSPNAVDVTPNATAGVLYDGMTSDGSKVFFTSAQGLLPGDTDSAADVYRAGVGPTGSVDLILMTPSGTGCNPVGNGSGTHWNSLVVAADCGAVALGGRAGVARDAGTLFYLSPEQIGGDGTPNEPNLYAVSADGSATTFVATLSPNDPLVLDSVHEAAASATAEFQTTGTGDLATFRSTALLTGIDNGGDPSVFLYDADAAVPVVCASCNQTLTQDPSLKGAASLARDGLSVTDDGRVFFNTPAALSVEDNNGMSDVYEWVGGRPRLISAGAGPFDSELLTTTPSGLDVFFFTHDPLDSNADLNGERTKIYDARTGGGFFKLPVKPQCAASDECHGPGTVAPGPPQIGSSGKTSDGDAKPKRKICRKPKVKRKGKCVKKKRSKKEGKKRNG